MNPNQAAETDVDHDALRQEQGAIQAVINRATTTLDLPEIASPDDTGLVLDVQSVGIEGMGLFDGTGVVYVECTDGTAYRLPEALRNWARDLIATHLAYRHAGNASMFPVRIEFGVINGGAYAEIL